MGVRSWLRGVKDSVRVIAEALWDWVAHPRTKIVLLVLLTGLAACKPEPVPTPTPSPTVEPTPEPTPCAPSPYAEGWVEWQTLAPQYLTAVDEAQDLIGDVCGREPEESLETLAAKLRWIGYCAGRMDDAVFVRRGDDLTLWEEYHAVAYATGCWVIKERMYRGVWKHE